MRIELLGLSGIGKTEIVKKCLTKDRMNFKGNIDLVKLPKPRFLLIIIEALILALKVSFVSIKSAKYLLTSKAGLKLLLSLGARKNSINKFSTLNDTLLVDSGLLMPFVESVMVDDLLWSEGLLTSIFSVLPMPNAVFYIYTNEELAYDRFLNRAHTKYSFSGMMDNIQINRSKYSNANSCLTFIVKSLEESSIKIINYNNKNKIDCNIVRSKILNLTDLRVNSE
jgi:hypothetical protein